MGARDLSELPHPARTDAGGEPVVVIGIPTYNRSALLRRCIGSALAQTYPDIRVVVSDNASTDDTRQFCEGLARDDARLRYMRQERNIGGTGNFNALLRLADGELFMWLADDDWIAPDYVERCVQELLAHPTAVAACGLSQYDTGERRWRGDPLQCRGSSRIGRVLAYYRQVQDNGIFYSVLRREAAQQAVLRNCIGGDWLYMAALAFRGELRTLDTVLYREPGGASASRRKLAAALGLPAWQGVVPITFTLAMNAADDVLRRTGPYHGAPWALRLVLAAVLPCWIVAIKPWQEIARRARRWREPAIRAA